jgi:hypothetical protein
MGQSINTNETRELIASSKVEGTAVYDLDGERLGTITNFMVDKPSPLARPQCSPSGRHRTSSRAGASPPSRSRRSRPAYLRLKWR